MKSAAALARVVLAAIILISFAGTAGARNMSLEVMEPAAINDTPIDSDPMRISVMWDAFPQPPQFDATRRLPVQDFDFHPFLDNVIYNRQPVLAVPEPINAELMEKYPHEDIGFHPTANMGKNPTEAVKQPEQCDPCPKNPTEAVKQPEQCEDACFRNPTQAVREPLCVECNGPTMRLNLKNDAATEIAIYSVNGRLIRRISAQLASGETELTWDGRTDSGARAASGVYFAQVQAGTDVGKGKLVLVR